MSIRQLNEKEALELIQELKFKLQRTKRAQAALERRIACLEGKPLPYHII
jgi:hypothetical protein